MRATSSETLPCPMSVTCEVRSRGGGAGREGCWVYQCTIESAGMQYSEGGRAGWRTGTVQPEEKRMWVQFSNSVCKGRERVSRIGVWSPMLTLPKKQRRGSSAAESNLCVQFCLQVSLRRTHE